MRPTLATLAPRALAPQPSPQLGLGAAPEIPAQQLGSVPTSMSSPQEIVWPPVEELGESQCEAHFRVLAEEHQVRHPDETAHVLRGEREGEWDRAADDSRRDDCATLLADGGRLYMLGRNATRDASTFAHAARLAEYHLLVSLLPRNTSFVASVSTADLAFCHQSHDSDKPRRTLWGGGRAGGVLLDSVLPPSHVAGGPQLLLPAQHNTWRDLLHKRASAQATLDRPRMSSRECFWRGSQTGHATWQTDHHRGRSRCDPTETTRACAVRLASSLNSSLANVSFGKTPNVVGIGDPAPRCILALDGCVATATTSSQC